MKIRKTLPVLLATAALLAGVSTPAPTQSQSDAAANAVGRLGLGRYAGWAVPR